MKSKSKGFKQTLLSTLVLAVFAITGPAFAQKPSTKFEGHIRMEMKMEAADGMDDSMLDAMPIPKGIDYYIKGDKNKVVMAGKAIGTQEILTIKGKDGKTQAYRLDAVKKQAQRMVTGPEGKADPKANDGNKVQKTTQTKVIAGYNCTLYKTETLEPNSGMTIKQDIWATTEIDFKRPSMGPNEAWTEKVEGFPVRIDMDLSIFKMTMLVSKVEKTPQPDSMFEIPSGYKIVDFDAKKAMPSMPKMED